MFSGNHEKEKKASSLLSKMIKNELSVRSKEFIAPYTEKSKTAVIKVEGVNYRFRIVGFTGSGVGIFQPIDPSCAKFVRDAEIDQVCRYLQLFPQVHLILVCQTDLGWCAYPFNLESVKTRFNIDCEVIVRNVSDAERFDVICTRFDGQNFWYEEPFAGSNPVKADEMRKVFNTRSDSGITSIKNLTPEELKSFQLAMASWKAFQKQTTESRVKSLLDRGGAALDNYVIRGNQIEITWQAKSGRYYKSLLNKDTLDVTSAGICLNGEDSNFHVKDLPGLIQEGEEKGLIYVTERVVENPRGIDLDE